MATFWVYLEPISWAFLDTERAIKESSSDEGMYLHFSVDEPLVASPR
jgi:hypothetical protein